MIVGTDLALVSGALIALLALYFAAALVRLTLEITQ